MTKLKIIRKLSLTLLSHSYLGNSVFQKVILLFLSLWKIERVLYMIFHKNSKFTLAMFCCMNLLGTNTLLFVIMVVHLAVSKKICLNVFSLILFFYTPSICNES